MDGVISDTQSICAKVEADIFKEHGINISPEQLTEQYGGTISYAMFFAVFQQYGKPMPDIEALSQERWEKIFRATQGNVKAIPGTIGFIKYLKKEGVPIAVASASRMDFIKLVLTELHVFSSFNAIVSAQEVSKGKPEPDVFLLAAKRLNVEPQHCLVIEDAVHGMTAAKRAGMKCIGLVRNGPLDANTYPADRLVRSLQDISLDCL